jgi:hypothetical protein
MQTRTYLITATLSRIDASGRAERKHLIKHPIHEARNIPDAAAKLEKAVGADGWRILNRPRPIFQAVF